MDLGPHFILQEFVPRAIYNRYGANSTWFLDPVMVQAARFMRNRYGRMAVNNWKWGGDLDERGFRLPDTTVGARLSQHKFGRACDCNFDEVTPDGVRADILDNQQLFLDHGITTIEHGDFATSWVHWDVRSTGLNEILIVKP